VWADGNRDHAGEEPIVLLNLSTSRVHRGSRVTAFLANRLAIAGLTAIVAAAQSHAGVDDVRLPPNLSADAPVLKSVFVQMWRSSPTFRRQCQKLAAADHLQVKVFLNERLPTAAASAHAWTVLKHRQGQLVSALVYVRPFEDTVQLVAHEVEHIIEQLDRVDLLAQQRGGNVWQLDNQAFETRRAVAAGRRVAWEVKGASAARELHGRPIPETNEPTGRLTTVRQHDRRSGENDVSSYRVSADGHHVVFESFAQLVASDRNRLRDVYVVNLPTGQMSLETPAFDGSSADGESTKPGISADGRFVVFQSVAGNLTERRMASGMPRVFLRDRASRTTRLLSATPTGDPANAASVNPAISADGTTVVFESAATDVLAVTDLDGHASGRLYLIRPSAGTRTRVDVSNERAQRTTQAVGASVSADGRHVTFMSRDDLSCGTATGCAGEIPDRNGVADIYLRDTEARVTRRITRGESGRDPDGPSYQPAISGDGRPIVFVSEASNLVRGTRKGVPHVYIHDTATGATTLVTHTPRGRPANGAGLHPTVSRNGGVVAFQSLASDLVCDAKCPPDEDDINLLADVFVYDVGARRTIRASTNGREVWMEYSRAPSIDDNGRVLAFASRHPVDERDEAHDEDLYVWRRGR
jgi:Tol biopolymer transport system component